MVLFAVVMLSVLKWSVSDVAHGSHGPTRPKSVLLAKLIDLRVYTSLPVPPAPTTTTTTTTTIPKKKESVVAVVRPTLPPPIYMGSHTDWMVAAGISSSNYGYVNIIVSPESGWNPEATNREGTWGLCQALPGDKMASAGADWRTNPVTQLIWCNGYALERYGSWAAAAAFHEAHNWW